MSVKVMGAVVTVAGGGSVSVTGLCRDAGISRKTFYKWVARFRLEGMEGLEERSRRPRSSPNQIPSEVEDQIVTLRKWLHEAGLDHGATTIQWHLGRDDQFRGRVPSVAGVHRVLTRRGLIVPEPKKRPKLSWCRFEAPAPNEVWQIDATEFTIATGRVWIFNVIDDHSRLAVASRVVSHATSEQAWNAFSYGAQRWGLPAGVLSDNGLCFSGKLRGFEVLFEANLRDAGIRPITGRARHPQTTGKVERFQQTEKKWLHGQPLPDDVDALQSLLDRFIWIYNYERPHQGIGRVTPFSRWTASAARQPADHPLEHPPLGLRELHAIVSPAGVIHCGGPKLAIHIGVEWKGQQATVIVDGHRANVFINSALIRHFELEPNRVSYGSGRPRGGPRPPRLQS